MKNKQTLSLIAFSILIVSHTSCKENVGTLHTLPQEASYSLGNSYDDFRDSYSDVAIYLSSSSDINNPETKVEDYSFAKINEDMDMPNEVAVNSIILDSTNKFSYTQFYDENLSTDIYGNSCTISYDQNELTTNFYAATPIYVDDDSSVLISNGTTFTWNSDPMSAGVLITVFADKGANLSLTESIYKEIETDDDGSFSIPAGWLDEFPEGTIMNFVFYRGNYGMFGFDTDKKMSVIIASSCGGTYIKE